LNIDSNSTYNSETVWSEPARGEGSGGGISTQFTRPAYQTGTNLTNLNREVPDVSADADPATGYAIYCTTNATFCGNSGWTKVGGTSGAAPLWAAIATDLNEYLAGQQKPVLGSASASLYSLYNTPQTYNAYHDITTGDNLHYPATSGYDMASGIGTPDVWNIARDLVNATPGGTGGPTQLLDNPGFDRGPVSWIESSSGAYEIVDTTNPHAGVQVQISVAMQHAMMTFIKPLYCHLTQKRSYSAIGPLSVLRKRIKPAWIISMHGCVQAVGRQFQHPRFFVTRMLKDGHTILLM
jgi:subtilase family serine protease